MQAFLGGSQGIQSCCQKEKIFNKKSPRPPMWKQKPKWHLQPGQWYLWFSASMSANLDLNPIMRSPTWGVMRRDSEWFHHHAVGWKEIHMPQSETTHTDIYITSASCWALQSSSSADDCFRDSSSSSKACTLCSARIALCSAKAARSSASSAASWKTSRSLLYRAHSFSSRTHSWLRILHCSASFWLSATCRFKAWAFRHASSCNARSTCLDDERRISA